MVEQLSIPIIVMFVVLALIVAMALFSRNYLKVPPNAVAVLSGRKRKTPDGKRVGYRMVKGGATSRPRLRSSARQYRRRIDRFDRP